MTKQRVEVRSAGTTVTNGSWDGYLLVGDRVITFDSICVTLRFLDGSEQDVSMGPASGVDAAGVELPPTHYSTLNRGPLRPAQAPVE